MIHFTINYSKMTSSTKLACFDFDHTLVKPKENHINAKNITLKNGREFPVDADDWQWLRPNVPEIIRELYTQGYEIYVITNQTKLWKIDMIKTALGQLEIPITVIVGFGNIKKPETIRKPNPLLFSNDDGQPIKFDKNLSFFCGDAAGRSSDFSDSDKQFAINIGMKFNIPEDLFPIEMVKCEDYRDHTRNHQEIVILVGYPSAGKSTWALNSLVNKLADRQYMIISGDELKTIKKMIKVAKAHLDNGISVIFDRTNPKLSDRAEFINMANTYNIPARCIVFDVDIETAMEWNTHRLNETGKKVPKIAFYLFRKNYVRPTISECEIVVI